MSVMGSGTVLPADLVEKTDLGDTPLMVSISAIHFNEGDDCLFVECTYPDGLKRQHQMFLPLTSDNLLHVMIAFFMQNYGKNVVPSKIPDKEDLVGSTITFKEI